MKTGGVAEKVTSAYQKIEDGVVGAIMYGFATINVVVVPFIEKTLKGMMPRYEKE